MTTTDIQFQLIEGNWHDGTITIKDTTNNANLDTAPRLDITNLTVELYLKASASEPDTEPLSSETGEITKVEPANGVARIKFTDAQTAEPGTGRWWRIDVVNNAGERRTVMTGKYGIMDV